MRGASAHPIQILPGNVTRFSGNCRLRNATLARQVHPREANDSFGISGGPGTQPAVKCPAGAAETVIGLKHWNKTGTFAAGMLYVDNRGSPGSRDQRAYRVGPKVVPRRVPGLKPAAEPP